MTKLEKILTEKGLKQSWLAKKINKSPAEINRWVKGRVIPVYANMNIIAEVLDIPIEEIFYKEVNEINSNSKADRRDTSTSDRRIETREELK